jgi:hypothetical protein
MKHGKESKENDLDLGIEVVGKPVKWSHRSKRKYDTYNNCEASEHERTRCRLDLILPLVAEHCHTKGIYLPIPGIVMATFINMIMESMP